MQKIQFESLARYKYRLLAALELQTSLRGYYARTEYIEIRDNGLLTLSKGYAWDGPSGPTVDTADAMRGSAGHDALYQLIALGVLTAGHREQADSDLRGWCIEDGMSKFRADYWYQAVRAFGGSHA